MTTDENHLQNPSETTSTADAEAITSESETTPTADEAASVTDIQQARSKDAGEKSESKEKYDQLHEQHMRLAADFENFRKRVASERESLLRYGAESTVQGLLPILDNLSRAATSLNEQSDPKMLYQSFDLLSKQLLDTLAQQGLKKIETEGQLFDPQYHEATSQVESADHPENTIVTELQSGFMLHERVLRPALVIVATTPSTPTNESDSKSNPFAQAAESE